MKPMKMTAEDVPLITERGGKISVFISPRTTGSRQFILGLSTLEAGGEVNNHVHDYSHEAFYVVKGQGTIFFENYEAINFGPGDAIHVPMGIPHKIKNTGSEDMQVVFTASPLAPTPAEGHRDL